MKKNTNKKEMKWGSGHVNKYYITEEILDLFITGITLVRPKLCVSHHKPLTQAHTVAGRKGI